jgi:hypothetical protein
MYFHTLNDIFEKYVDFYSGISCRRGRKNTIYSVSLYNL